MDKGMFKELMKLHGIKQTKFEVVDFAFSSEKEIEKKLISIKNKFTLPLYVKPANSGSSV
jgi:D-alanine-D-alanine ligase-like ATP-grasp enzyme